MAGAELILNLSASNEIISKHSYRQQLLSQQSARCMCGYIYTSAGIGESTTDIVFSGHSMICENGAIKAENENLIDGDYLLVTEIDVERLQAERQKCKSYKDCAKIYSKEMRVIKVVSRKLKSGISKAAFEALGWDKKGIVGVTMPGFGTTDRTYDNAMMLMKDLGITIREIPIREACMQHFKDIGHDCNVHNVLYENIQARERTKILMDVANQGGGFVVGTGDLSELALGWCTYNGDHMSMYAVNASIPKTLVRSLVGTIAKEKGETARNVLEDIIATPVSPELLPISDKGELLQKTEEVVGPYELHDFYLYYMIRFGFSPSKIFYLAKQAFREKEDEIDCVYDEKEILKWMKVFYNRFFNQQFKRSCLPDGPKVGSICLSPRGDWRMPSDAQSTLWLEEIEALGKG